MTATHGTHRKRLAKTVRKFMSDSSGSPAIEYIVAAAIIGAGVVAGVSVLSSAVSDLYGTVIAHFRG